MRVRLLAFVPLLALASAAAAAERPDVKGLFLLSDFPAVSIQPGTTTTIPLKLQNLGLAPERFQLSVSGVPSGWTATLLGGGQPIAAAMPATDGTVNLDLRVDAPAGAAGSSQTLTVKAQGPTSNVELPVVITLAKELPAKLKVDTALPALRGTSKSSFEYQLTIKNDAGRNLLVSFAANAPRNFETSFTEAYGSQELSSVAIDAGKSKDIKLKVRPPSTVDAGTYPVSVTVSAEGATAKTDVSLEIVGQPRLQLSGRDGLVSARAEAGKQASIPILISNTGSAPADSVELSSTAPTGWKIEFDPKTVEKIEPNKDVEVTALVTPTEKSLAGDYMTTLRASSRGESASTQFRVTVTTSTLWGIVGAGIIGAALLIMVGAVARFGRR
ncbi:MAG TPA: NEW3 domain-containing protein [Xanthobacteraceae bacterium]|nr:NEW3 domain-containing protein [Xanthobacteraceae bacterium]